MSAARESAQETGNVITDSSDTDNKTIDKNNLGVTLGQVFQGIFSSNVLNKSTVEEEESSSIDSTVANDKKRKTRKRSIPSDSENGVKRRKSQTISGNDSINSDESSNDIQISKTISDDSEDGVKRGRQEVPWECTMCESKFTLKGNLFRHYRDCHKEMSPARVHEKNIVEKKRIEDNAIVNDANDGNVINKGKECISEIQKQKEGKCYDCKLCEAVFNSTSARNQHYTRKHQIKDEKLLFLPNGIALVESSLEQLISVNPDWFKVEVAAAKSNESTKCKLCDVELSKYNDEELNWHYKTHKVNRSVIGELVRLKNIDVKRLADMFSKKIDSENIKEVSVSKQMEMRKAGTGTEEAKAAVTKKVEIPKRDVDEKAEVNKSAETERAWRASFISATPPAVMMFLCRTCKLATASYDNAVTHSQDHILKLNTETQLCDICDLKFAADFETHKQLHLTDDDLDRDSFRYVVYDYRSLMSDNWLDMFDTFPKAQVDRIVSASIYFSTRCVRLQLERDSREASSRFTLFKCLRCKKYVDPQSIASHVDQEDSCAKLSCYPCEECQKPFFTQKARDQHAITHKLPNADRKYRTVLFNDQNDFKFNKILWQASVPTEKRDDAQNGRNGVRNVQSVPDGVTSHTQAGNQAAEVSTGHEVNDDIDKVADVYKCQCGLCFDRLDFLFNHLYNCSPTSKIATKTCLCGLVFEKSNYDFHAKMHCDDFSIFNVKEVTIRIEKSIDVRGMAERFRNENRKIKSVSEVQINSKADSNNKEDVTKKKQDEISTENQS